MPSFKQSLISLLLLVTLAATKSINERYEPVVSHLTYTNGASGVQYYAQPGAVSPLVYSGIPSTVFLPGQYGGEQPANFIPQPYKEVVPTPIYPSISTITPSYQRIYGPRYPVFHQRKHLHTKSYNTRPSSLYASPSFSIQQSIDLSDSTPNYLTTPVPPLTGTTYGPPRPMDLTSKRMNYYYHKGHRFHIHPHKHIRPYSVYTHKHKDHLHTHHYPSTPLYQSKPYTAKPKPNYLPPKLESYSQNHQFQPTPTPTTFVTPVPIQDEKPHNYHAHPSPNPDTAKVRFPQSDAEANQLFDNGGVNPTFQAPNSIPFTFQGHVQQMPHAELTQAYIGRPGEIKNNDVSIPYKLAGDGQKPVAELQNHQAAVSQNEVLSYFGSAPDNVFQNSQLLNGNLHNYADNNELYQNSFKNYQNDLRGADTIRIPIAVFPTSPAMLLNMNVKRADENKEGEVKYSSPEVSSSEWVPMNGGSNLKSVKKPVSRRMLDNAESGETAETKLLQEVVTANYDNHRALTNVQPIGDIISGKIPGNYNPFSDHKINVQSIDLKNGRDSNVVTSKISFGDKPGNDIRKVGKVIDEINPLLSRLHHDNGNEHQTSDLIVSSVLKFS